LDNVQNLAEQMGARLMDNQIYLRLLKEKVRHWEENNWHVSRTPQPIMDMYAEIAKLEKNK
jgi:hypothetical protein